MATIGSRSTWPVSSQSIRAEKGPVIRVKRGNVWVKMHQRDAEALGLVPVKSLPKPQDKQRVPNFDKGSAAQAVREFADSLMKEETGETPPADDFTTIPNIGPATARSLRAHGIETFDQLRSAGHIGYISIKAMDSIEEWRKNG